jgi:hypothetical protein
MRLPEVGKMLCEKRVYIEQLKHQLSDLGYSSLQIDNMMSDFLTDLPREAWDGESPDGLINKLERQIEFAWKCLSS